MNQKKDQGRSDIVLSLLAFIAVISGCQSSEQPVPLSSSSGQLVILTWNVRGYPEKDQTSRDWFHNQLIRMKPNVICIQEIANQKSVDEFLSNEKRFSKVAFLDSDGGQDNAVFAVDAIEIRDLPDPEGFQHPAQAAYISYLGFDAVIVTVHLSWTDPQIREHEKGLLRSVVSAMLKIDPDVIIVGDFNTEEKDMQELARTVRMTIMVPSGQDGIGTTHAGNRYDYFLISPDLANEEAVSCHIEQFAGNDLGIAKKVSDHLPVVAWFKTDIQFKDRK